MADCARGRRNAADERGAGTLSRARPARRLPVPLALGDGGRVVLRTLPERGARGRVARVRSGEGRGGAGGERRSAALPRRQVRATRDQGEARDRRLSADPRGCRAGGGTGGRALPAPARAVLSRRGAQPGGPAASLGGGREAPPSPGGG